MNLIFRMATVVCASFFLWMACTRSGGHDKNESLSNDLLLEALCVVDSSPQDALTLLEDVSDSKSLYEFDRELYMKYVVIRTQARYMEYLDITGDSLILSAYGYFAEREDREMAARAGYYAAAYWYEEREEEKAEPYWLSAFHFSEAANFHLFMAKSAYWLGIYYFNQEEWEDSRIYCEKALALYRENKWAKDETYRLDIINMLGFIYRMQRNPKQALVYFDEGLHMAQRLNNRDFESRFLRNKGALYRDRGEYDQAKDYFAQALSKFPSVEDSLRIYLSYARLYRSMRIPDSTIYYLNRMEERISVVTNAYTRRNIYKELSDYYKYIEVDAVEATRYSTLAYDEVLAMNQNRHNRRLQTANELIGQLEQEGEAKKLDFIRWLGYAVLIIGLLSIVLVALVMGMYWLRKKINELREMQFSRILDQRRLLMTGLRSLAKGMDDLIRRDLDHEETMVWEQMKGLREEFCEHIAQSTREMLQKLRNGKIASLKLSQENLCVIFLSHFLISDEDIGWMLGRRENRYWYIKQRKEEIGRILAESNVKGVRL